MDSLHTVCIYAGSEWRCPVAVACEAVLADVETWMHSVHRRTRKRAACKRWTDERVTLLDEAKKE